MVLAESGGITVIESGPRIFVASRGTHGWYTARFVFALFLLIGGGGGLALLVEFLGSPGGNLAVALAPLVLGSVGGVGLWRAIVTIRRRRGLSLVDLNTIIAFDRSRRLVCDAAGNPVASVDGARLRCRMQLASSSQALHVEWDGGAVCIARGSPFAGSVGPIENALRHSVGLP